MTIENNPVGDGGQASEPQPFSLNDDGTVNIPDGDSMTSVSVEELGKGFMRQSDYTRKTQDLALQRKDLASAQQLYDQLQANPHGMVTALADQLGVQLPQAPAPQTQNNRHDDDWDSGGWDEGTQPAPQQEDPRVTQMMDMFTQLQSQLNQVATNQARTSVETELDGVVAGLAEIGVQVEDSAAIVRAQLERVRNQVQPASKISERRRLRFGRWPRRRNSSYHLQTNLEIETQPARRLGTPLRNRAAIHNHVDRRSSIKLVFQLRQMHISHVQPEHGSLPLVL